MRGPRALIFSTAYGHRTVATSFKSDKLIPHALSSRFHLSTAHVHYTIKPSLETIPVSKVYFSFFI